MKDTLAARSLQSVASGQRPGKNAAMAISGEHLQKALSEGTMGRSNPRALITTAHYVLVTGFGLRSVTESYNVLNGDLIHGPEVGSSGLPDWIQLSERVTKTRRDLSSLDHFRSPKEKN